MSFLLCVLVLQGVVIGIMALILRGLLNRMLLDQAVRYLQAGSDVQTQGVNVVTVQTASAAGAALRQRIQMAVCQRFPDSVTIDFQVCKKIRGGAVIHVGSHVIDCSLQDRLERAFHKK